MLPAVVKNKIEQIWLDVIAGGVSQPTEVIEQLTYLMFAKQLDEHEADIETAELLSGEPQKHIFGDSKERCVYIPVLPIRCASLLRSAAFLEAMPDTGQITGQSASCSALATHGLTSPMSVLMLPSRTAQLHNMAGSAGRMPHGIRNFRCLR